MRGSSSLAAMCLRKKLSQGKKMTGPKGRLSARVKRGEGNLKEARGDTSNSQTLLHIRIKWEISKSLNSQISLPID